MAEICSQQYNFETFSCGESGSHQSMSTFTRDSHSNPRAIDHQSTADTVTDSKTMAVPISGSNRREFHEDVQNWEFSQVAHRGSQSHVLLLANGMPSSDIGLPLRSQFPEGADTSTMRGVLHWDLEMPFAMDPVIMPHRGHGFFQNAHLVYGDVGSGFGKVDTRYGGGNLLYPIATNGLPQTPNLANDCHYFHGSDLDSDVSSPSPCSEFSIPSEPNRYFSSGAVETYPSSSGSYPDTENKFSQPLQLPMEQDVPSLATSYETSASQSIRQGADLQTSALPYIGSMNSFQHSSSSFYNSQETLQPHSSANWYTTNTPVLPSSATYAKEPGQPTSSSGGSSYSPIYPSPPRRDSEQAYPSQRTEFRTRSGMSHSMQLSTTAETNSQRKEEDQILLEGKKDGLTYKEIRKKMRTRVAESTLRGRYRSLTKDRKDRVRKPVWTDRDIYLLGRVVRDELDQLDDSNDRTSTRGQKLSKLSWKRVAEYIAKNGGSYHFGNSTCKKKWSEIDN